MSNLADFDINLISEMLRISTLVIIMHKDAPHLDGAYAAFGMVIDGMDVVNKIAETRTDYSDRPLKEQKIKSMTVDTFGEAYDEPEKC